MHAHSSSCSIKIAPTRRSSAGDIRADLDAVMPSVAHGTDRYENNTDPAWAFR